MNSIFNPFSLVGKTILVTGASSGIGKETALRCAKMGSRVILTARNTDRLQEVLSQLDGEGHKMIVADLTDTKQLLELVQEVDELQGVVLAAGCMQTLPFAFGTTEKVKQTFDVNYFSTIELLRLLVKKKKIQQGASIVFVSSVAGVERFTIGNSIYSASKAAIHAMMKTCAKELAVKRIRVNSVNPGMVNTPLIHGGAFSEEELEKDVQNYPLKRYGEPADIANGILFLLSDASSWVTGHALVIDGGVTI